MICNRKNSMLLNRISRISISLTTCSVLIFGCSKDDSPTTPGAAVRFEGRVTDDNGFTLAKTTANIEDATVFVAEVQADGSLNVVSDDSVMTSADGTFEIEANVNNDQKLVVVARKDPGQLWEATINADVESDATVTCQPLNGETTTEADVYQKIVAEGQTALVSYADIASYVDVQVSNAVRGDANAAVALSSALRASADARNLILTSTAVGATAAQIDAVTVARMEAQADLEADLYAANGSQTEIAAAFDDFYQAEADAVTAANISLDGYARAKEVSSKALVKNATNLSASAQFALNKKSADLRAYVLARAVEGEFREVNSGNELSNVVNAGVTLRASINGATTTAQITAAFETYHNTVVGELQTAVSGQTSAIATADAAIRLAGGTRIVLATSVSAAGSTQALVDAYLTFYAAVQTLVETTLSGGSTTEVSVATNVLILTNMQV